MKAKRKGKGRSMKRLIKKYVIFAAILMITGCSQKKEIPSLEEAGAMQEEQLKEVLSDFGRDEIIAAWGEPGDALSGVSGEIFFPGQGKMLTVYYSSDGRAVESVKTGEVVYGSSKFEGTILEIHGTSAVVEVDEGYPIRGSGTQVGVSLEDVAASAKVGDRVRVTWSGGIMETFPLQLENQASIQLLDDGQKAGENWDSRVSEAILSENQGRYSGGECAAEGHVILDVEANETEAKVYALTMYGEYEFQDGNFVKGSGTGAIPAVFVFQRGEDGAYALRSYEVPEDGGCYTESIRSLFPQHLQEICMSPTEEVCADLERQEKRYACEYLETLGRTAAVGEYRDYEHPLLTDLGVSVEVSNSLAENRDLADYPYWIGNIERREDGVRYVYQMDYDQERQRILLTKTEYDSGNVEESYEIDAETGEVQ